MPRQNSSAAHHFIWTRVSALLPKESIFSSRRAAQLVVGILAIFVILQATGSWQLCLLVAAIGLWGRHRFNAVQRRADALATELHLLRETACLSSRQHDLDQARLMEEFRREVGTMGKRLEAVVRESAAELKQTTVGIADGASQLHKDMLKSVERERSDRILSAVRHTTPKQPPRQVAIIMSPERAGSTWLFDSLRRHPFINVDPSARICRALGASSTSGRYPVGLLVRDGDCIDVELRPNFGAQIPGFRVDPELLAITEVLKLSAYCIEKLHPRFFGWSTEAFFNGVERLQATFQAQVKIIYRTRAPLAVARSLITYKSRNPDWLKDLRIDSVPEYMIRNLKFLLDCQKRIKGLTVSFEAQRSRPVETLATTFGWLWPDVEKEQHSAAAVCLLREETHAVPSNNFFGPTVTNERPAESVEQQIQSLADTQKDALDECDRLSTLLTEGVE